MKNLLDYLHRPNFVRPRAPSWYTKKIDKMMILPIVKFDKTLPRMYDHRAIFDSYLYPWWFVAAAWYAFNGLDFKQAPPLNMDFLGEWTFERALYELDADEPFNSYQFNPVIWHGTNLMPYNREYHTGAAPLLCRMQEYFDFKISRLK